MFLKEAATYMHNTEEYWKVWMLPAFCPWRVFPLVEGMRSTSSLYGSRGTGVITNKSLPFPYVCLVPALLALFWSSILQQLGSQIWRQVFLSTNLALSLVVAWPWQVTSTFWDSITYKVEIRKFLKLQGLYEINVSAQHHRWLIAN